MKEFFKQPKVWIFVLAIAHLPFLLIHYMRLWQIEHYQYFPFALGIFAVLVRARKGDVFSKLNNFAKSLLALDIVLLGVGTFLSSPWLVCIGAVCLCFAMCSLVQDSETDGSLSYLALLPLMTIRLPLGMDLQLIQYLQSVTTQVASNILNHLRYLHFREGNVLSFPDRQFLVEEACSGVQSLFIVLFLATLIVCGNRRKLVHSSVVLASAVCFAGVMNVIRVVTISVAWQGFRTDLSAGWQHDALGYAALIVASLSVYGIDVFLSLMFSVVTFEPGNRASDAFQNPLSSLWNWFFQAPKVARNGRRPRVADFMKLNNLLGWTFGFIGNWFSSRDKKLVPASVLFLLTVPGLLAFVWWLESSPQAELVAAYEESLIQAATDGDLDAKSVYLKGLVKLRPTANRYRYQLAMHLLDSEQRADAISQLEYLTTPGRGDYALARIWLARQALSNTPVIPLTSEQIEGHLLIALELEPRNIHAKRLIGEVLLKKGHYKAAEDHFLDVVDADPSLAFSLAKVQTKLGRSPEQVKFQLDVAIDFFQQQLMKNPQLVQERIRLSECLVIAGRDEDAERVLSEGLTQTSTDPNKIKKAFSDYYVDLAARRLRGSVFNRDLCAGIVRRAITLDPSNRKALTQALTLNSLGAKFEPSALQPAIRDIREVQPAENVAKQDRVLLVQALAASGDLDSAIVELKPMLADYPEMNIVMARLLNSNGKVTESQKLVQQLLVTLAPSPGDTSIESALGYVDVLNMALKFDQSRELLNVVKQRNPEMNDAEQAKWNLVSGQTAIAEYDDKQRKGTFEDAKTALNVLDTAWASGTVRQSVLKRLAVLSCSDDPVAEAADRILGDLLVNTNVSPDVYNMVGSQAIRSQQFDKAKVYLERAFRLTRGNPTVLNNLALALVRGNSPDHERALQLTKDALEILPQHPDVLSTRAEVYVAMKRWEDARGDLEESLQKRPEDLSSRRLLARVCDEMGDKLLAENHRRKVDEIESMVD